MDEFCRRSYDLVRCLPWESAADSTCAAVIVEPRQHPLLEYVIDNVMYYADGPSPWSLHVFVGTHNRDFVLEMLRRDRRRNVHVHLMTAVANLSRAQYNALLLSTGFWESLPPSVEHVLIFQTDSVARRFGLHRYLAYDYVGAPWHHHPQLVCGNGGFSLRRRRRMVEAIAQTCGATADRRPPGAALQARTGDPEDLFFAKAVAKSAGARMPPAPDARRFSVESVYVEDPLALHQPWTFRGTVSAAQVRALLDRIHYWRDDSPIRRYWERHGAALRADRRSAQYLFDRGLRCHDLTTVYLVPTTSPSRDLDALARAVGWLAVTRAPRWSESHPTVRPVPPLVEIVVSTTLDGEPSRMDSIRSTLGAGVVPDLVLVTESRDPAEGSLAALRGRGRSSMHCVGPGASGAALYACEHFIAWPPPPLCPPDVLAPVPYPPPP